MKHLSRFLIALYVAISCIFIVIIGRFAPSANWSIIAAASGLVMILSAWLGLDLTGAYSRSLELPKGISEKIDITRYIFALLVLLFMTIAIIVGTVKNQLNDESLAIIWVAIALVLGFWVASRKAMKLAKEKGNENTANTEQTTIFGKKPQELSDRGLDRGSTSGRAAELHDHQDTKAFDSGRKDH